MYESLYKKKKKNSEEEFSTFYSSISLLHGIRALGM